MLHGKVNDESPTRLAMRNEPILCIPVTSGKGHADMEREM